MAHKKSLLKITLSHTFKIIKALFEIFAQISDFFPLDLSAEFGLFVYKYLTASPCELFGSITKSGKTVFATYR